MSLTIAVPRGALLDDTLALPEQVETAVGLPLLAVVNHQPSDGAP